MQSTPQPPQVAAGGSPAPPDGVGDSGTAPEPGGTAAQGAASGDAAPSAPHVARHGSPESGATEDPGSAEEPDVTRQPAASGAVEREAGTGSGSAADGSPPGEDAALRTSDDAQDTAAMPDAPEPLGIAVEPTGRSDVDASLARLAEVDHLGVAGHLGVYENVHSGLRDALTALDQAPGPPPPDAPHDSRS